MNWSEQEDTKYSKLYESGYPAGQPDSLVDWAYPRTQRTERTIDLGCGRAGLASRFDDYTGVDVSEYVVKANRVKYPSKIFYHGSLHELDFLNDDEFINAFCADVMEHIPEENVDDVLSSIAGLNVERFFFGISTRPSKILDDNGNNLHLTIQDGLWWSERMAEFFLLEKIATYDDLVYIELSKKNG